MRRLAMWVALIGAGCVGGEGEPGVDAAPTPHCDAAFVPDPDTCSAADPTSCDGDDVCIDGACVSAWGRSYELSVVQARMPPRAPDGSAWDYDGGPPDPVVVVRIGSTYALITEVVVDAFVASFEERAVKTLARDRTWEVWLYDADIAGPQPGLVCRFEPLSAAYLRERRLRCEGRQPETIGSVVILRIVPVEEP